MAVPGRVAAVSLAVAGATLCVGAQQPAGRDAAAVQQPVFRATTTYVVVDVVANDRDGRPITDLTKDDFEIHERGLSQTIASFERVTVPVVTRTIDLRAAAAEPPIDVFDNLPPPPSARAILFLVDTGHLESEFIVPTRRVLTTFLESLTADDSVALVYTSRSDSSQDFTHDTGRLIRSINQLNRAVGGMQEQWPLGRTMKYVVNTLSSARESRRMLVLVGHGLVVDHTTDPELFEALALARQLNVPIYTLDPRGLADLDATIVEQQQGGRTIANETGGRAFVNNWSVSQAARDLMTDNSAYYLLGFYPSPDTPDGRFHEIDVTVKRPGVTLRSRAGYMTETPPPPNAKPPRLVESLESGLAGGALFLRAAAVPIAPSKRGASTLLTVDMAYPDLPPEATGTDRVDLAWIALDPDAKIKASGQNSIEVPLGVSPKGRKISLQDLIDLPEGPLTLRLVVSSRTARAQGTVHIPIDVRSLDLMPMDATRLVLAPDGLPSGPVVALGTAGRMTAFFPSTVRTFRRGQRIRVFARLFGPGATMSEATLALRQGYQAVLTEAVRLQPSSLFPNAADCDASVIIGDTPPGRYVLEMTMVQGAVRLTRSTLIEIVN